MNNKQKTEMETTNGNEITPIMNRAPEWLDEKGRKAYEEMAVIGTDLSILAESDKMALSAACAAYSDWRTARDFVTKNGQTYVITTREGNERHLKYPQVDIEALKWKQWTDMLKQFGFTPASRDAVSQVIIYDPNEENLFND